MKHVYVIRHCAAEGQEADAQLTRLGAQQAISLANFLLDKNIDFIISSPYERAVQTILPLAEQLGLEVVTDVRLSERVLSTKQLINWRELLRDTYDNLDLCFEGGETTKTAIRRAISVLEDVLGRQYKNIVLVSHGNLISLLLHHFDNNIGFLEWEALTNPDVFQLTFLDDTKPTIERIWHD